MNAVEQEITRRAIDHECPDCGARPNVRCRIVTKTEPMPGYTPRTKVDVKRKPCPDRVTIAWREWLSATRSADAEAGKEMTPQA